ncbi:LytTR family DNA-binding domain-containing protein [Horticoccus luteus]|uniref:LytTR family DNA-binding domain-containing protein n=1 Tax=Horticoccus luteus TaxID=2862869 RepID=A0A8F9XLN5_9BACT|nr:LytTR family DNA-binding domain-containing protein [Horticoccus luteus]QYM79406.1 LytTR family DNA-binding domain-containing protein [Horticoccus luteus]
MKTHAPLPRSRLRAVIADDEPAARRGVRLLLERDGEVEVVGEAIDGPEAVALISDQKPDLAFLDVQMPGGDGFEVLRAVGVANAPAVIFVTAYDEYALRAFEVNAIDYLLKPYDDERFRAALERAKADVRRREAEGVNARLSQLLSFLEAARSEGPERTPDRILVKSAGEIFFLKASEIDWIEAEGDYMKFHVAGRAHLMRETMARLEARLDAEKFIRIHRSTIVNVDRLRKLTPAFGGEYVVVLQDGTKLKLSRGYHARIAPLLKETR